MIDLLANIDPTTITLLSGVVTACISAIGVQYKTNMGHFQKIESKLDDCESDRARLWSVIATQCGKDVSELKGDNK